MPKGVKLRAGSILCVYMCVSVGACVCVCMHVFEHTCMVMEGFFESAILKPRHEHEGLAKGGGGGRIFQKGSVCPGESLAAVSWADSLGAGHWPRVPEGREEGHSCEGPAWQWLDPKDHEEVPWILSQERRG